MMEKTNLSEVTIEKEEIKPYLLPVLAILVIIVFSLTVFKNTFKNWLNLRSQQQQKKQMLAVLTEKSSQLEELDEEELKRKVNEVEFLLPSKKAVLNAFISLASLAREANVDLKDLSFEGTQKQGPYHKAKLNFVISGKIENINIFFNRIVKIAPIMEIEDLGVSGLITPTAQEKPTSSLALTVNVYYQPLPEELTATSQPLPEISVQEAEILSQTAEYIKPREAQGQSQVGKDNLF